MERHFRWSKTEKRNNLSNPKAEVGCLSLISPTGNGDGDTPMEGKSCSAGSKTGPKENPTKRINAVAMYGKEANGQMGNAVASYNSFAKYWRRKQKVQ